MVLPPQNGDFQIERTENSEALLTEFTILAMRWTAYDGTYN